MSEASDALDEVVAQIGRPLDKHPWADIDKPVDKTMTIGDLDSEERGSGARMNADKLAVEQIPVRCWHMIFAAQLWKKDSSAAYEHTLLDLVDQLAYFQEGKTSGAQLVRGVPMQWVHDAIEVFSYYSTHKYKQWNWLKGMAWSVPLASAIRHAKAVFAGEVVDPESGFAHTGHFVCNLIMLAIFYDTYREGNDFPDPKFFEDTK